MAISPNRVEHFFQIAISVSRAIDNGGDFHFGGVLVGYRRKVLNIGVNRPNKTHPLSPSPFKSIHCELDTILGVSGDLLVGSSLFVARTGFHNRQVILTAFPCQHCQYLIRRVGISTVYSTVDESRYTVWDVRSDKKELRFRLEG